MHFEFSRLCKIVYPWDLPLISDIPDAQYQMLKVMPFAWQRCFRHCFHMK